MSVTILSRCCSWGVLLLSTVTLLYGDSQFFFQIVALQANLRVIDITRSISGLRWLAEQWWRRWFGGVCVHSHRVQIFLLSLSLSSSQSPFVVVVVATTATILYLTSSKERKYSTSTTRVYIRARTYPSIHTSTDGRKKRQRVVRFSFSSRARSSSTILSLVLLYSSRIIVVLRFFFSHVCFYVFILIKSTLTPISEAISMIRKFRKIFRPPTTTMKNSKTSSLDSTLDDPASVKLGSSSPPPAAPLLFTGKGKTCFFSPRASARAHLT